MPGMVPGSKRAQVPAALVTRCKRGDRSAFEELYNRTVDDVHRILHRLAGPEREMEDLVQQVYLQLFRSIHKFAGRSSFSSYLFGFCLRVAKKHARGAGRFGRLRRAVAAEAAAPGGRSPALPDEQVARARMAREVHRALADMSFKLRTVLVLYEMEGLSGKQIAERLGIAEPTVWTRLHHARKAFRRTFRCKTREPDVNAPG